MERRADLPTGQMNYRRSELDLVRPAPRSRLPAP
jgi:hypothetical protein